MYEASVSNGQNNLYRELLDYANDEGKLDVQFRMKNSALLSLTGLSEPGLDKARNSLVQLGLIKYIKGKKNVKPPEYRVVKLYGRSTGYPTSNPTTNEKSRSTGLDEVGQPVGQGGGQPVGHKELTGTDLDFTGTDHDEDDAGVTRGDVIDKWTSLWGFPNAIAMPEVNEWLDALPADVVDFAITIAGEHQVKATGSLKYMRAVIEGWQKRDISTLDQAKKAAEEHDKRMKSERGAKPTRAKETLPDWAQSGTTPTATRTELTPEQQEKINARIARLQQNGKTEQEATT
ncbi:DNA replication protein DnaD [Levilactobacillus brevis]|uniref:DNA replication protein DnaD n=2 Tax=Levilactobacillus brevis TaxID=1580 RepID=A0AAJ5K5Q3_LEVBR|nr:DNA replication protein DnaD [Levilactobacillus brevis]